MIARRARLLQRQPQFPWAAKLKRGPRKRQLSSAGSTVVHETDLRIFRHWNPEDDEYAQIRGATYATKQDIFSSLWQMGRPWSALIKASTTLTGCGLVLGYSGMTDVSNASTCVALTSSMFLHSFAVYALDDYWDRMPDRINHPERPLPSGRIRPSTARAAGVLLFGASTAAAAATGSLECLVFMSMNNLIFACYTPLCRYSKIAANASIVYWNIMPWIAAPIVFGTGEVGVATALLPALFMLPPTVAREIVFDWKDHDGDRAAGLRTIATVFGKNAVFGTANVGLGLWGLSIAGMAAHTALVGPAALAGGVVPQSVDFTSSWLFLGWNAAHMGTFAYFLRQYQSSDSKEDYRQWRNVATSLKSVNVGAVAVAAACGAML